MHTTTKCYLIATLVLALVMQGCREREYRDRSHPAQPRDRLMLSELMGSEFQGAAPLDNRFFMPMGKWEEPRQKFEGTLVVPEFIMQTTYEETDSANPWDYFPGFTLDFFTHGKYLVPVSRGTIHKFSNRSYWCIIISPGTVWFEPDDSGMSRASFPFALINESFNVAHNGVATFVYDETQVSSLFFQATQETDPISPGDFWGVTTMEYKPHSIENKKLLAAQFAEEERNQIAILPFSALGKNVDTALLEKFNGGIENEEISATGLIYNNTLYLQPCTTRYGEYPYRRYMRHGAYSLTKAMGALIALLRLAEKYGKEVFDLKIADNVMIKAAHDGWKSVTFADALNMATGVGDSMPERLEPNVMQGDEEQPKFFSFMRAKSKQEKLDIAFSYGDYPWGPGEVARYNSINTFILSAAMDAFLKSKEGSNADIWDFVLTEVFRPIGIFQAPIMRTIESDGSKGLPILGYGLYPNVDDLAKLSILLQNGGRHRGRQLLHSGKLAEALYRTDIIGLPTGEMSEYGEITYHLSFNGLPFRCKDGRVRRIPVSTGFGGNHWVLLPNGITTFRFCDANKYGVGSMIDVAEAIYPFR
jgi:CubicO group peptidase (beta-lactamase class C family)